MKRFVLPLAILAACAAFQAQAGDNPPPALLAKIQIATQAYQNAGQSAGREFKDMKKFVRENEQAPDGGQRLQFELQTMTSEPQAASAPGTLIGGAIGGHANDGDE